MRAIYVGVRDCADQDRDHVIERLRVQVTSHAVGWVEEEVQTWLSRRVPPLWFALVFGNAFAMIIAGVV